MYHQPSPILLLRQYSQAFPRAWRQIADMRSQRGKTLPWWPDWCFIPIAGAIAIITDGAPGLGPAEYEKLATYPPAVMATLAAWRVTKGVYRFDDTLRQELTVMPLEGNLPAEIFYTLPEWCIYIETPGMAPPFLPKMAGFFAHLEYDPQFEKCHESTSLSVNEVPIL